MHASDDEHGINKLRPYLFSLFVKVVYCLVYYSVFSLLEVSKV